MGAGVRGHGGDPADGLRPLTTEDTCKLAGRSRRYKSTQDMGGALDEGWFHKPTNSDDMKEKAYQQVNTDEKIFWCDRIC